MNNRLAKLFILISIIFGTLMLFITPPFNSPDEDSHFIYAYELSEGNLIPSNENGVSGFYVPKKMMDDIARFKEIAGNRDKKITYEEIYKDQMLTDNYKEKKFVYAVINNSPKIAYLAPAVGIKIASSLKLFSGNDSTPVSVLLQFARFFSLLAYSIIGFFAIKITPKFKKTFFAVLLMPVALFLRSMVSYDGILLVTVALALANMLRLIDNKAKFTKKDYALFIITGFILLNVKVLYSIIFLCLFAIPKEVFKGENNKGKIKAIAIIGISIVLLTIIKAIPYAAVHSMEEPLASKQIEFITSHPFDYLSILIHNVFGQLKVQEYWMLGTFGCLDTYMPVLYIFGLKIFLLMVFILDAFHEKIKLPLWLKIGLFLFVVFDVCGMYTMMYISWTPKVLDVVGGNEITGIQGRYYIPFLFLIPVIFNNRLVEKFKKKKISNFLDRVNTFFDNNIHYATVLSLILVVIVLVMRYYC